MGVYSRFSLPGDSLYLQVVFEQVFSVYIFSVSFPGDIRCHYSGPELDYICFVHSLSLLSQLLCYRHGREFFPVKVKEEEG